MMQPILLILLILLLYLNRSIRTLVKGLDIVDVMRPFARNLLVSRCKPKMFRCRTMGTGMFVFTRRPGCSNGNGLHMIYFSSTIRHI